jgi:predicted dehydrogenase
MRRDKEKLIDYARRHNIKKYTTDYLDLLRDETVDAVYIATPPNMHHFYTLEAVKYGKAVYVEKPMALTVSECEEMIRVCRDKNVPLFVAYYRREHEKFRKAKALVDSLEIGEIRAFNYLYSSNEPVVNPERAWLLSKEVAGGGLLYDIGSHMIDTLIYLFGDVEMATGISSNQSKTFQVDDVTTGMIRFRSGVQGSLQLSFNGNERQDQLTIIGSKGTLKLSIMSNDPLTLIKDDMNLEFGFDDMEHVQMPLIKRVVDTLRGKDFLDATGIDGLRTQEILETFSNSTTITYG